MDMDRRMIKTPPIDRKPTLLKEFLRDDFSSCSSNGFRSYPRRASCYTSMRNLLETDLKGRDSKCIPKKKLSAFQKASVAILSVVRHLQFSSEKQSILPRSISRRLKKSFTKKSEEKIKSFKVKDILRWKSFRDSIALEEKNKRLQLEFASSPIQTSITTTTTTTTTTTSSDSWSESDSDFTSEFLQSSWSGSSDCSNENEIEEEEECKKYLPEKKKRHSKSKRRCNEVVEEDSMEKEIREQIADLIISMKSMFQFYLLNKGPATLYMSVGGHACLVFSQDLPMFGRIRNNASGSCETCVDPCRTKANGEATKFEDKDQFSPVSVLDFPFEDDESSSSFQSSLESMERTKHKLMEKIRRFESLAKLEPLNLEKRIASLEQDDSLTSPSETESDSTNNDVEVEQKDEEYINANELLEIFTGTISKGCINDLASSLLLDFFRDEVMERNVTKKMYNADALDCELLKVAKDWMNGDNVLSDWGVEESRQVHIKEMERGGEWRRELEEERRELAVEMEVVLLNTLVDDMLFDLLS